MKLFEHGERWYLQHSGGLYWKFSYRDKSVAQRVQRNLEKDFFERPENVPKRLSISFVQTIESVKECDF